MTDLSPKTLTAALGPTPNAVQAAIDYCTDAWQRTILTWDVLREPEWMLFSDGCPGGEGLRRLALESIG